MLAEVAKLPPPIPVNPAHTKYGHSGSPGWANNTIAPMTGTTSANDENMAKVRPPKIAVATA